MKTINLLIQAVEEAVTPEQLVQAVQVLADSRSEAALSTLIASLGYNNPSAAIAAMHGLVSIGRAAVKPLIALMDDYNYGARAYTVRALAMIGDPQALDILLNCAEHDFAPSVRRAAIKGLGNLRWDWGNWSADTITKANSRILQLLQLMLSDPDWSMRYAAIVALDLIGSTGSNAEAIALLKTAHHHEADLAVKFRGQMALQNLLVAI